jgi:hypothetical protein
MKTAKHRAKKIKALPAIDLRFVRFDPMNVIFSNHFRSQVFALFLGFSQATTVDSEPSFIIAANDGTGLVSSDGKRWQAADVSLSASAGWRSHCAGNEIFVAIDRSGNIHTSSNSTTWMPQRSSIPEALHRVTYGNGLFVAVGNEGAVVTSHDGVSWTRRQSGSDQRLRGITYSKGQFAAVGYAGTILTSRDAIHWNHSRSGTTVRLQDIASNGTNLVAVGWNGVILTSGNGSRWKRIPSGTTNNLLRVFFRPDYSLSTQYFTLRPIK